MDIHPQVKVLMRRTQYAQRTPEWYEVRKDLLTASDAAAALRIKPFASYSGCPRDELMQRKLGATEFRGNRFTRHGQQHEEEACVKFASVIGQEVHEFGLLLHPDIPWLGASPDGITSGGAMVEIKCPLLRKIVPGKVPHHYMPQIQVQLEVCGLEMCYFVEYLPATHAPDRREVLNIVSVQRDKQWFAEALPHLQSFMDDWRVRRQTFVKPPPPTCLIKPDLYSV